MSIQFSSCTAVLASALWLIAAVGNGQTQSTQQQSSGQNFYITTPQTGEQTAVGRTARPTTANTYLAQSTWQQPQVQNAVATGRQSQQVQQVSNSTGRNTRQLTGQTATANYYTSQINANQANTSSNQQSMQQTFYPASYVSNNAPAEKKGLLSRLTGRKSAESPKPHQVHQNPKPVQTFKGAALKACKHAGTVQDGVASWYGGKWHGRKTANGERYNQESMTAAHKTLPFGTVVKVTNQRNGRECLVRINNRGPFTKGRIIDLSKAAASQLGMINSGIAKVKMEVLGRS